MYFPYLIIKFLLVIFDFILGRRVTFGLQELISFILVEDWFVHVILIQYIAFFVIWKFLNVKRMIFYSFLVDCVLSCVYIIEKKPEGWFNALWLFTFGMACSQYKDKICSFLDVRTWIKSLLFLGVFCIVGVLFAVNKGTFWANPFKVIGGVFLCLAICGILHKLYFGSKPMRYVGKRSMFLYIVHINVWPALQIENIVYKFWIALVLSVIFSGVVYRLTEFLMRDRELKAVN